MWVGRNLVLVDDFWTHMSCMRCLFHVSAVEAVSLMVSDSTETHFVLMIRRPLGLIALSNPRVSRGSSFSDDFWVVSDSDFHVYFWVNKGFALMNSSLTSWSGFVDIFDSVATQFSLTTSESTVALCADESTRYLWKRFRWRFVSRKQLSFPWLFLSQMRLCVVSNPNITFG